jgi:arylamine N-acetyltransferase
LLNTPLDDEVRTAYLTRLGITPEPPSVEGLFHVVGRHAERVPYETFWIQAGEEWSIDPSASAHRIATTTRGGYCYHLNGALGLLLRSLGYDVHAHVGGVQGAAEPDPAARGNHLVLTVEGLPSDDTPDGRWYVDTGLGDALHQPLPLVAGSYVQSPFTMDLEARGDDSWRLVHDETGGFHSMVWEAGEARREDFEERHRWLSTAAESGFVKVPMAERRDGTGVDVVRGLLRLRIGGDGATSEPVTERQAWFDLVADVVGIRFETTPPEALDRLWETALAAHRQWEREQR